MWFKSILCMFVIMFTLLHSKFISPKEKVILNVQRVETCPNEKDSPIQVYTHVRKYNRTHAGLYFNCTLTQPFGDQYMFRAELRTWGDGGWKYNGLHYEQRNPCKAMQFVLGDLWKSVLSSVNVSTSCPVAPGFFEAKNVNLEPTNVPFLYTGGRYLGRVDIYLDKKLVICGEAELEITTVPR